MVSLRRACLALVVLFLLPILSVGSGSAPIRAAGVGDVPAIIQAINHTSVAKHLEFFSGLGSRVTGYPGCVKAADYIEHQLLDSGVKNVTRFSYDITVPIDYGANLTVLEPSGGRVLSVHALAPNMVQTCPTPPEGLEAPLLYVGDGSMANFNGLTVKGNIVLMDFNTGYNWQNALLLGAKAVLLIEPSDIPKLEAEEKCSNVPVNFPRIWVGKDDVAYLLDLLARGEVTVNVKSNMQYETMKADDIYGFIGGTDPTLDGEILVLTARFDSWSIVPSLAPGANEAVGAATLLELAKYFTDHPAKRPIMILALSGQNQALQGSREFIEEMYWSHQLNGPPKEWWVLKTKYFIGLDINTLSNSIDAPDAAQWRYWWANDQGIMLGRVRDTASSTYDYWELVPVEARLKTYRAEIQDAWSAAYGSLPAEVCIYGNVACDEATDTRCISAYQFVPTVLTTEAFWWPGPTSWTYLTIKHLGQNLQTPLDTYDRLNWANLWPQLEWTFYSLDRLANENDLGRSYTPATDLKAGVIMRYGRGSNWHWAGFTRIHGQAVTYDATTASYSPLPGALVFVYLRGLGHLTWPVNQAYGAMQVVKADENGRFEQFGWGSEEYVGQSLPNELNLDAYVINSTGHVLYAPDLGMYGAQMYRFREKSIEQAEIGFENNPFYCIAFPCASIYLSNALNPNNLQGGGGVQVLDITHAPARSWGYMTWDGYNEIVFVAPEQPYEILIRAGGTPMTTLLNLTAPGIQGNGYTLAQGETIYFTPEDYATQLYYLNFARGGTTAQYGVSAPAAVDRLRAANHFLAKAREAYNAGEYDSWLANSMVAWGVVVQAWQPSMAVFSDVENSVLFYFMLLLPFVLVFEKLTTSWLDSRRRMLTVLVIFIAFSVVFSFIHPGFVLASNIFGVLVGFIGGLLCIPILFVLFGDIRATFRRFRAMLRGYTVREVEMAGALSSAVSIGVTHMRKRRLRTLMMMFSVSTVVYLIIMASSVAPMSAYRTIDMNMVPPWQGVEIVMTSPQSASTGMGQPSPVNIELLKLVQLLQRNETIISERGWMGANDLPYYSTAVPFGILIVGPKANYNAFGVLGLSPEEIEVYPKLGEAIEQGRWFEPGDSYACMIGSERAMELGISKLPSELAYVGFGGSSAVRLSVVAILNDTVFGGIDDLWSFYQPIDPRFVLVPGEKPHKLPLRDYIIVPWSFVRDLQWTRPQGPMIIQPMNPRLYSIAIKFRDPAKMMPYVETLANPLSQLYFFIGSGNKTVLVQRSSLFEVSLTPSALLPTLISSIMLFNVTLGSLYERRREVQVYTSVGLSPTHVGFMFLSETFVYAIVASVLGYLGAIVTNFALKMTNVEMVTTNYASWSVLFAVTASVICTVLPGLVTFRAAGRLTTPSLERRWTLKAKPRGDEWSIPLPFRPMAQDAPGVIVFLSDFFKIHEVEHAGLPFVAKQTGATRTEDPDRIVLSLVSRVFLEPYEAGVSQETWIDIVVPRGRDVADVSVRLHRLSGTLEDWERFNYRFIDDVRKQLLLWRGLPPEKRVEYVERSSSPL